MMDDTRLGTMLLQGNVVREEDLERCLEIQALTGGSRPLGQILIDQDVISKDDLDELLRLQRERRQVPSPEIHIEPSGVARYLSAAVNAGATELFLSEGKPVMMRLGGQLQMLGDELLEPPELWQFLLDFMGPQALDMLADQRSVTQDYSREGYGRGRMSAFRHFDGACVVVRLHPEEIRSAEEAGISEHVLDGILKGQGLILLAGEAGSGVTSTMATLLKDLVQSYPQLVVVLDENQEYDLPEGNAVVVTRRIGRDIKDYSTGLESAMRENPDVIIVADLSSPRAFDMALRAAEGGRLVIGALPAKTVQAAIRRALNFYPSYDVQRIRNSLASVLNCVLRLQLVPGVTGADQVMASELLVMDQAARNVVRSGSLSQLNLLMSMEHGRSGYSIDVCLEQLLESGAINLEDAFHYATEKGRFLRRARSQPAPAKV